MSDELGKLIETYSPFQIFKDARAREAFNEGKAARLAGVGFDGFPKRQRSKVRDAWCEGWRLQDIGMRAAAELARVVAEHRATPTQGNTR